MRVEKIPRFQTLTWSLTQCYLIIRLGQFPRQPVFQL